MAQTVYGIFSTAHKIWSMKLPSFSDRETYCKYPVKQKGVSMVCTISSISIVKKALRALLSVGVAAVLALPSTAYAGALPANAVFHPAAGPASLRGSLQPFAMTESVLDTYCVLYCPFNSSHNRSLYQPTYKVISFKTNYTRLNPDELIDPDGAYASPICGHVVTKSKYKCNYRVW